MMRYWLDGRASPMPERAVGDPVAPLEIPPQSELPLTIQLLTVSVRPQQFKIPPPEFPLMMQLLTVSAARKVIDAAAVVGSCYS